jgi:3-phosphoshikimate 1-carboxyvinyltransferase
MDILVSRSDLSSSKYELSVPGDKSISHRAVIIGSLAENESVFDNFLFSEDCLNTINIFQKLGVEIDVAKEAKRVTIKGVGLKGLKEYKNILDVGNSGTSIRLVSGVLAGQSFDTKITGDESIQKRPMRRIIGPLELMGAKVDGQKIEGKSDVYPPLTVKGCNPLRGINYVLPVASAQVKSAILFASLFSNRKTFIEEPEKCRNHSERFLKRYGANIEITGNLISCSGKKALSNPSSEPVFIPSDISSAAFFIVMGCLLEGVEITLKNVGINPTRDRLLDILKKMGANIELKNVLGEDFEPYGDVVVKGSKMMNIELQKEDIPFLIDEIPILAIAAMFSDGKFRVSNAKELRVKESDRISAIENMVEKMGGKIKTFDDGFEVEGQTNFNNFEVDSFGDHRIAMSSIIGSICAGKDAVVKNCSCINTSFPEFFNILDKLQIKYALK